ncbi:terminase small subunit [Gordonia phage Catfish]|uniref:Terminase small subunit n=1 Tax=Gordonia phage Catfish TaxID=2301538 RepID=A0A385D0H2_9CAUD|nr:terminase small subunit [Gordonia phage Catfish]AXQ51842.1 terminase small subunit [Gordonia phage Catfish]
MSDNPESLRGSVDSAIENMDWLTSADVAAKALARSYADQIDAVLEGSHTCKECGAESAQSPEQITKALYLGPHLLNALKALGGTPEGRAGIDVTQEVKGALSGIRKRRTAGS